MFQGRWETHILIFSKFNIEPDQYKGFFITYGPLPTLDQAIAELVSENLDLFAPKVVIQYGFLVSTLHLWCCCFFHIKGWIQCICLNVVIEKTWTSN